jgi:hypothetical protein
VPGPQTPTFAATLRKSFRMKNELKNPTDVQAATESMRSSTLAITPARNANCSQCNPAEPRQGRISNVDAFASTFFSPLYSLSHTFAFPLPWQLVNSPIHEVSNAHHHYSQRITINLERQPYHQPLIFCDFAACLESHFSRKIQSKRPQLTSIWRFNHLIEV